MNNNEKLADLSQLKGMFENLLNQIEVDNIPFKEEKVRNQYMDLITGNKPFSAFVEWLNQTAQQFYSLNAPKHIVSDKSR